MARITRVGLLGLAVALVLAGGSGSVQVGSSAAYGPSSRADYCVQVKCSPMDLVSDHGVDANGFPLNPDWGYLIENGQPPDAVALCGDFAPAPLGSPSCSSQPVSVDAPAQATLAYFICPAGRSPYFGSFHGHVNWMPATYEGTLVWDSHSAAIADDDYSLNLSTLNGAGATVANNSASTVHAEFNAGETINNFDDVSWWKAFHHAVDSGDAQAAKMINGHYAVVTGLIGLDTVHNPRTESHPVYSIAIQADRKSALSGGTDRWAIFARNWGNEGYCSQYDWDLPTRSLTVSIPWQNGAPGVLGGAVNRPATDVKLIGSDLSAGNVDHPTVTMSVLQGKGVLLTFALSSPDSKPLYWGTVDLQWTFGPPPSKPVRTTAQSIRQREAGTGETGGSAEPEVLVTRLWNELPRSVRASVLAQLPRPHVVSARAKVQITVGPPPVTPRLAPGQSLSARLDGAFVALGEAQKRVMCAAFKKYVKPTAQIRSICTASHP